MYSIAILAFLLCQTLILIWIMRTGVAILQGTVLELDERIAEMMRSVLEGGLSDLEGPNPLVQLLVSKISENLNPSPPVPKEISKRDDRGRIV